jgi:hypothetical protein
MPIATIKKWLRRRPKRREIFLHEDDWGETEVLPAECFAWCEAELARIRDFASAHRAPEGAGWTGIYVRKPPPRPLVDLAVSFSDAATALAASLEPFDAVVSGTFSSPDVVPHVLAFGPAPNAAVVLAPDKSGAAVEMISLVLNGGDDACARVKRALAFLPTPAPLILIDWTSGTLERL